MLVVLLVWAFVALFAVFKVIRLPLGVVVFPLSHTKAAARFPPMFKLVLKAVVVARSAVVLPLHFIINTVVMLVVLLVWAFVALFAVFKVIRLPLGVVVFPLSHTKAAARFPPMFKLV